MEKKIIEDLHADKITHYVTNYPALGGMKYSPTYELRNSEDQVVMDNTLHCPTVVDPEYVRRILARMNYCTGMSTEELEKQNQLLGVI